LGDRGSRGTTYSEIGHAYSKKYQYSEAVSAYKRAFEIHSSIGDDGAAARDLMGIGFAQKTLSEYKLAAESYKQALDTFKRIGSQEGLAGQAWALRELATACRSLGDYVAAENDLQGSLELYSKLKEPQPREEARAEEELAAVYSDRGDYDRALALYKKVRPTLVALGYKSSAAVAAENLGTTLFEMGNRTEAFKQYEISRKEFQEVGDKHGEAWALAKLAQWYVDGHLCDEGLKYASQALTLAKETNYARAMGIAANYMARAYLCAKSLQEAEVEAQHSLESAARANDKFQQAYNLETLALIAEAQGDIQRAVENADKSVALWDSMSSRTAEARSARANLARWKGRLRKRPKAEAQVRR
jgi:tetratricopeptide (TPR) repeat protein